MSGKDKVTKAQVDSILAEFKRNGNQTGKPKRTYTRESATTRALKGDIFTTKAPTGETLWRAKKGAVITDPNTLKYLERAKLADAQSADLGKPREHHKSLFNRITDVLSRGNYGVANAFLEGQHAAEKREGHNWDELKSGLAAMPGGFWRGLTGKKKTRFSEVLHESDARDFAQKNHVTLDEARTKVKKGGFKRGLEGLILDVALDPTTYLGVGLVSKGTRATGEAVRVADNAIKSYKDVVSRADKVKVHLPEPELADHANKIIQEELTEFPGLNASIKNVRTSTRTRRANVSAEADPGKIILNPNKVGTTKALEESLAKIAADHTSTAATNAKELLRHTIIHEMGHHASMALPAEARDAILETVAKQTKTSETLRKELSHYATKDREETLAEAWAEHRILGDKARPIAKMVGKEMEKYLKEGPKFKDVKTALEETAAQVGVKDAKDLPDLIEATARNLSPKVKKEFRIKFGPTSVGVPLVAEATAKAFQKVGTIPGIKHSVDGWNKLFRASAHIPKELNHIRQEKGGDSTRLITEHAKLLQAAFQGTTKEQRVALMRSLRAGAVKGSTLKGGVDIYGQPIPDLMTHVVNQIHELNQSIKTSGISIDEINDFLKGPYKIVDQKKLVGVQSLPGGGTRKLTESVRTPDFLWDTLKNNNKINDPAHFLYLYSAAHNQAVARRTMWNAVAESFGAPTGDLAKVLVNKHGYTKAGIRGTEDFVFHPEIAEGMRRMNEVFANERSTGAFLDHFDTALRGFKATVTKFNPSFHTRTFLGEMLLGYMGGMKNIPRSYAKAQRVIKGRSQEFLGNAEEAALFADNAPKSLINASNKVRDARATTRPIDGSKPILRMPNGTQLSADQVWHFFEDKGLKTGYAATDLAKGPTSMVGGKLKTASNMVSALTEGVEDYGRLAHFIDVLSHTKAKTLEEGLDEASRIVRKYHLDYTNVTHFESAVMTRLIPFYKWIRLSTPVMAEILLTQPGKALLVPKTLKAISDMAGYDTDNFGVFPGGPDAAVPSWLRDHGAMPWANIAGNTNYLDPTAIFPLAGSAELADGGASRTFNPALKLTADLMHGSDNLGNQVGIGKPDNAHYLASQLPQTNFAEQILTKRDPGIPRFQTVAQFLANPGNQPNTQKRMRGEAFREQQAAYHHRKEVKKEKGVK